jgi:hypothetical protein
MDVERRLAKLEAQNRALWAILAALACALVMLVARPLDAKPKSAAKVPQRIEAEEVKVGDWSLTQNGLFFAGNEDGDVALDRSGLSVRSFKSPGTDKKAQEHYLLKVGPYGISESRGTWKLIELAFDGVHTTLNLENPSDSKTVYLSTAPDIR